MAWSIATGVVAAALAPWVDTGFVSAGLLLVANAGAVVYALTWSFWTVRELRSWRKLAVIYPLLLTTGIALVVVWSAFFMSLTLRH